MTQNTNKAFKESLDRFVHIGNVHYNGKHFDNVLNIFNDLDSSDQKSLLVGVYYLFSVMEGNVNPSTNTLITKPKPETLNSGTSLEGKHVTELKIWLIKMIAVALTMGIFAIVLSVIIIGGANTENNVSFLGNVFKIIMLLN